MGLAGCVAKGRYYVVGGVYNGNNPFGYPDLLEFDPASGKWNQKSDMSVARGSVACAEQEGKLWVAGGQSFYKKLDDVERYDYELDPRSDVLPFQKY